ncbi:hypothetical protein JXM83_06130 [Candidatus Woesearchaeota archaeon]|nr:hypothetical protein [Candidatus Woesearchaeota archaeon]
MESYNGLRNIFYDSSNDYVLFDINPKIYPLKVVYQAAYILMDKASVILGGNPDEVIKVEIRPLDDSVGLGELIRLFNDELLTYASYFVFSEDSKKFRDFLMTNLLANATSESKIPSPNNDSHSDIDDVEKIFEEWEDDS